MGNFYSPNSAEPQKWTELIYDTTATQGDNIFTNITDMFNAIDDMQEGTRRLIFRQSVTAPSGAWNFDGVSLYGNGNNYSSGGVTLTFATGTTISSWAKGTSVNVTYGLKIASTSTSPIFTTSGSYVFALTQGFIGTTTAEFVKHETTGGTFVFAIAEGSVMEDDGYEVFNTTVAAGNCTLVIAMQGVSPTIDNETLRSTNNQVYGQLNQTAAGAAGFSTHSNLGISFNFSTYGVNSDQVKNTATKGITATTTQAAIDELPRVLNSNSTQVGNVGTGEDDLISYTIPASTLSTTGDTIEAEFSLVIANNANQKRVKVKFGTTTMFDTGATGLPVSTSIILTCRLLVFRTGSNTQKYSLRYTSGILNGESIGTSAETDTATIVLKCTGETNAASNDDVTEPYMLTKYNPA